MTERPGSGDPAADTGADIPEADTEDLPTTSVGGRRAPEPDGEELPEEIAGYRILRLLGAGGMGEVYLAEQVHPVRRRVALKVLRDSLTGTEANARFLAERHAMGRLDHPNIGRILEAGDDEEGRPFFAMEWVDGLPIDRYCDRNRLSIEARLRLFVGVCRGVAHAHQKQLLHRDLKPSNILVAEVDGMAVPKVIDFGVAKALDQPLGGLDMRTNHLVGTPVYTSPEGLSLENLSEPDTRSDVYSLGVVLCELLTGSRPHDLGDEGLGAFLRRMIDQEPRAPSTLVDSMSEPRLVRATTARQTTPARLRRRLRGDLDCIVLQAIARDRRNRYSSAADLAADLARHLRSEPLAARPYSKLYVVSKFVRRHRLGTAVAILAALAILLAVVALSAGLQRTRAAEAGSRADAEAARRARDEAEAVSSFLSGLFLEAAPDYGRGGAPKNPSELSAVELLERGAARAEEALADEPQAQIRVQAVIGKTYISWARYDAAHEHLQQALSLADAAAIDAHQRAGLHVDLGIVESYRNDFDAAEEHFSTALRLSREPAGGGVSPDDAIGRQISSLEGLARVARKRGEFEEARGFLEQALALARSTPDLGMNSRLKVYSGLVGLAVAVGRPEDGQPYAEMAYELTRAELPEDHPTRALTVNKMAVVLAMQGKLAAARPLFEESLELQTRILGRRHPDVATALNNLGVLLMDLDRPEDSLPLHREALDIRREVLGDDDPMTAWSLDNLSVALIDLEQYGAAREYQQQALDIRIAALGPLHFLVGRSHYFLGQVAEATGDDPSAESHYRRSVAIRAATLPADHTALAETRVRLGALLLRRGDDDGQRLIDEGMAVLEVGLADDPDRLEENRERVRRARGA